MSSDEWIVTMPKLGETVTEGELTSWLKNVGDAVAFDDPLFEVSTDKVDSEIPSPYDGVIAEILVQTGETVPIGTPLVRIVGEGKYADDGSGVTGADRLPEASRHAAAGGGPSLSDPASPTMGGSEGMGGEDPGMSTPSGEMHDITMPKLGETVTEGTVSSWLKSVGDPVAFDDPLFEVSTDKVDSEIPSPYDGVLVEILVAEGDTVPIGTVLARIGAEAAPGSAGAASPAAGGGSAGQQDIVSPLTEAALESAAESAAQDASAMASSGALHGAAQGGHVLSPLVRRLIAENSLDASAIRGTGVGGRIRREDVQQAITAGTGRPAPTAPAAAAASASPAAAGQAAPAASAAPPKPAASQPSSAAGGDARDEVVQLSRMRLAVAEGMKRSQTTAAAVWTSVEVDFDNVEKVRAKHKDRFKKETGSSLSYLPFVSRATIDALRAFPTVNASIDIDAKTMTMHPYVNLGIAVDLDQQGLVVPVVKDADGLNMRGVAKRITELAAAARGKKLSAEDMRGSTFTITGN